MANFLADFASFLLIWAQKIHKIVGFFTVIVCNVCWNNQINSLPFYLANNTVYVDYFSAEKTRLSNIALSHVCCVNMLL